MTNTAGDKRRARRAIVAALLCALIASLAVGAAPAAASGGEGLPVYSESLEFPPIDSAAAPEEFSWRVELAPGDTLTQVSETEAVITRPLITEFIHAPQAYDHHGAPVLTTLTVSQGDVVTLTVHHREAAYVYPVSMETPKELDTAPLRDLDDGGMIIPAIGGPESPERYPFQVTLGEEQFLERLGPTEIQIFNARHVPGPTIDAGKAHDADGASVPTTLEETGRDVVTLVVHFRAGNPAADLAPFEYPITAGEGWEGGFQTEIVQMRNPNGEPAGSPADEPSSSMHAARCTVPWLRGLNLRAAKARLHKAHCAIGKIRLAAGATAGKGEVVKQFHAVGLKLPAGTPVAVKVGNTRG